MHLTKNAKALRTSQTDAENRLWYHIRAHRFMGLKFRRQKPIGDYIVDFICHECHLIVELDGGQHQEMTLEDERRDGWLQAQGYTVLRFWDNEVLGQTEAVLEKIRMVAHSLSPAPLPQAGEGS